ncbi:hypothetical protein M378DRAFT_167071 [Amanita muscaria Koide BX008]|uniref:Uncharacterized protein n=1 Tax=Amanita muscaria (strain Koide BX008) TaxID=946122 RepID=A0A0C2T421_AMAMK|nr:hypothetical protein M378DRAFT_167071 [Amanita muscaria Koide BX008]
MRPMPTAVPRLNNFEARQTTIPSTQISTPTYLKTVPVGGFTSTKTVTSTTTTETWATTTTTVTPPTSPLSLSEPQTITKTIASSIILTTTTGLTIPPASVSVATATTTVSSTIIVTASASSRQPLSDNSSQRTITGLAIALAGAIVIACLAGLCWRRRRKEKAMRDSLSSRRSFSASEPRGNTSWNSQSATRTSGLASYTSEPYKLPIQKSAAYGGLMSYFGGGQDSLSGVTYAPDSQTQTLDGDGNEEFFPRSLSQCTEIGAAF